MEVKYFSDTDTLLINFSNKTIVDTRDLSDTILVEFDQNGEIVSMTIEHAQHQMDLERFSYQRISSTIVAA